MYQTSPCPFCPATKAICFWGELRPYAPWRRWVLLACSVLLAVLFGGIMWYFTTKLNWLLWLISVPMFPVSLLGIAVSISGCERCVVRLFGDGGI